MENLDFEKFKAEVHRALLSQIDLEKLSATTTARARSAVAELVQQIIASPASALERHREGDGFRTMCSTKSLAWALWSRC